MDPLFSVHRLNEPGLEKAREIGRSFNDLLLRLVVVCPGGREFSIVKTKLEEACFFAKKAMACDKANQVEDQ